MNAVAIRATRWVSAESGELDIQREDLGIHLELVTGLDDLPRFRGDDSLVPGRPGRIRRIRVRDYLELELSGWVQGVQGEGESETDRLSSYRQLVDDLLLAFAPDAGDGVLEVDTEDGNTRSINASASEIVWGPEEVPGVRAVSVALNSVDPDWT